MSSRTGLFSVDLVTFHDAVGEPQRECRIRRDRLAQDGEANLSDLGVGLAFRLFDFFFVALAQCAVRRGRSIEQRRSSDRSLASTAFTPPSTSRLRSAGSKSLVASNSSTRWPGDFHPALS